MCNTPHNTNTQFRENEIIIANIEHLTARVTREAIEIEKRYLPMNTTDDSIRLPIIRKTVLQQKTTGNDVI